MSRHKLNLTAVAEPNSQENFRRIERAWIDESILNANFEFLELEFIGAVTNRKVKHFLGFTPKDIIQTQKRGVGDITFNYDLFDKTHLDVTTTGACTLRIFVGRFDEGDGT